MSQAETQKGNDKALPGGHPDKETQNYLLHSTTMLFIVVTQSHHLRLNYIWFCV